MSSKEIISPKINIKSEVPIAINSKINNAEIPFAIEKKDEIEKKEIKYGETSYRWFFLISYCLSGFVNQMQWVAYSAILTAFSINYEKPLWKINMFSLIFMIVYPIVCIPEAWMLDKFSIRISLILAAACNIIGSGLKLLVNKDKSLASCYIGQTISCLFQPVLLNSPGKIAANWFREELLWLLLTSITSVSFLVLFCSCSLPVCSTSCLSSFSSNKHTKIIDIPKRDNKITFDSHFLSL